MKVKINFLGCLTPKKAPDEPSQGSVQACHPMHERADSPKPQSMHGNPLMGRQALGDSFKQHHSVKNKLDNERAGLIETEAETRKIEV